MTARPLARLGAALAACAVLGLACAPSALAQQEPPQAGADEVYAALGLTDLPAEYVIVVDTSASMAQDGRYDGVRAGLRAFLDGLRQVDTVTLIVFDERPEVTHHGPVVSVEAALATLPAAPTGRATDLGSGLERAVDVLSGSDKRNPAALVVFTDAKPVVPQGSRYADPAGAAWGELERRGRAMADRVTGFAVPTTLAENAADQVARLIPDTTVLSLSTGDQISSFLSSLRERFRDSVATARLRGDLAAGATATWTDPPAGVDLDDGVDLTVTFRSHTTALPLEVVRPELAVPGASTAVTGLPDRVRLEPGQSRDFPVRVEAAGGVTRPGGVARAELAMVAGLDSPWRAVLLEDLGLPGSPPRIETSKSWAGVVGGGVPPLLVGLLGAGVVAAGMGLWWWWHRGHPYMVGSLVATSVEQHQVGRVLEGLRKDSFHRPHSHTAPGVEGVFRVRGVRRDGDVVPSVSYRPVKGSEHPAVVCVPGEEIEVYGMSMLYTGHKGDHR
ncbi:vWA domain-containing protein [Actinokineospora sp. G85]|uniref:vWA domain-containing protein n=1 Tax=Actinokineospora sp. G85 TaxID=3406626 RepID=UPI003C78F46A